MAFHERRPFDAEKLLRNLAGGKLPSDKTVHEATMRYIESDWAENGHKYAQEDWERIEKLITDDHRKHMSALNTCKVK